MNILFLYNLVIKTKTTQEGGQDNKPPEKTKPTEEKTTPLVEHKVGEKDNLPKTRGKFYTTKWDPLLEQAPFNKNYQMVLDISGFYEDHDAKVPEGSFGDINLWTLNLSSSISTVEMNQQSSLTMKNVLDHSHATAVALQGVREAVMVRLKKLMNEHYQMVNNDAFTKDMLSGANYYFPILFDKKVLMVKQTGYIRNYKGVIYASFAVFEHKSKKIKTEQNIQKGSIFTIINMDLYSTFRGIVEAQLANIISDIKHSALIRTNPVFFMGGMGALSLQINNLLNSGYKNLIEFDHHNQDLDKTTVHGKVEHSDNVQRDFIIVRDPKSIFTENYARILSNGFPAGEHFPVQAILSYT